MEFEFKDCLGANIRSLSRVVDAHYRAFFSQFDITENQATILFAMHELGRVEQGKIGEQLALEKSTVSRNVKLLERKELVKRTADYRPEVALSKKGIELVEALKPHWNKAMEMLTAKMGEEAIQNIKEMQRALL